MCDPVSILAIVGSVVSSVQQNKAANAQSDYQDKLHAANKEQANLAAANEYQQNTAEAAQAGQAALEKTMANDLRAKSLTATANVASAGSGAIDNTGAVTGQYIQQGLQANTGISQNLRRDNAQFKLAGEGIRSNQYSRIQNVSQGAGKVSTFGGADAFKAGLAGGSAYFSNSDNAKAFKAKGNKNKWLS